MLTRGNRVYGPPTRPVLPGVSHLGHPNAHEAEPAGLARSDDIHNTISLDQEVAARMDGQTRVRNLTLNTANCAAPCGIAKVCLFRGRVSGVVSAATRQFSLSCVGRRSGNGMNGEESERRARLPGRANMSTTTRSRSCGLANHPVGVGLPCQVRL